MENENDTKTKLEILKKAIIIEKKRSCDYQQTISSLEKEILTLKYKNIQLEEQKMESLFNLKNSSFLEPKKKPRKVQLSTNEYETIVAEYETQNENLKKMLNESFNSISLIKSSFQDLINEMEKVNKGLDEKLNIQYDINTKNESKISLLTKQISSSEIKIQNLENKNKNLIDEREKLNENFLFLQETNTKLNEKLKKTESVFKNYIQVNSGLSKKISTLKEELVLTESISEIVFNGYKKEVLGNKKAKLTFAFHDREYILLIQYENRNYHIPFHKIKMINLLDQDNNFVQIKYLKPDGKTEREKIYIIENSNLFIESYKSYYDKHLKNEILKDL